MRFQNSTLIVTGGASGIGRATIERALAEGAAVLAVDRDADALAAVKTLRLDACEGIGVALFNRFTDGARILNLDPCKKFRCE